MLKIKYLVTIYFLFLLLMSCQDSLPKFKLGIDVMVNSKFATIQGKRVAIITNQTGLDSQGNHIIDLFFTAPGVELVALFGPEHGIRGDVEGGFDINDQKDPKTGVPIISIYGNTNKPTPEMLQGIDVLIFDIQDVGARFYTYISTMSLCMEAAAENNIEFIVLDRPNPITGMIVEGPVLKDEYKSFVGIHRIALRHGMTVGELAKMFNEEGWLANGVKANLTVIPMENWRRNSWYGELRIQWIKPSPNMPLPMTALLYPGMGLLETCNISEGRGTAKPFENIGAPWLDNVSLTNILQESGISGVSIDTISYIPVDMPGAAMNPKYEGQLCHGLLLSVTDPRQFQSVAFGLHLICAAKKLHPDKFAWNSQRSPRLMFGNDETPVAIDAGQTAEQIIESWTPDLVTFQLIREKYLLYE
ncbi:DUF1343 domain-containing protein [candidate division KSB1 bacterium]|nr:DUF1343 domain-containing protein [candidate division KSB1 bacterium]